MARSRIVWVLALACALAVAMPGVAAASATQESIFQDDNQLLYTSPRHVAAVLDELAALGVERIRVSLIWALVAPDPLLRTRPSFNAANPGAYPPGAWERYDVIVSDAQALGIGVDFDITSPDPLWASTSPPPNIKFRDFSPSAAQFGQFVTAVGRRYSGSYVTQPPPAPPPPPATLFGIPLPQPLSGLPLPPPLGGTPPDPAPTGPAPAPLPRVDYWEIWNEPDEGGWLAPQWRRTPTGRWAEASPVIYRGLLDAAWNALGATGHGHDTILIGDTAAKGGIVQGVLPALAAVVFVRDLYCVGRSDRPLAGARAAELSCPTSGDPRLLPVEHPALFDATGYAHHPYSFNYAPYIRSRDPNWATMADLPRFERTLARIYASYGRASPGGVPLYLTEYGYKSDPPNPFAKTTQAEQASYINEGEYMAWGYPYVRALAQFELVDAGPVAGEPVGSKAYWATFQTGLIGLNGRPKPSFYAYRLPIWLPDPHVGPQVTVWGQLRPANHAGLQYADIEYAPAGTSTFAVIREVQTSSPQGFILAHVPLSTSGSLRLAWLDPATGQVDHSRIVRVR